MNLMFWRKHPPAPQPQNENQRRGLWGEAVAARNLEKNGFKIIAQRVKFGNREEIDLVAREGDTLVFVEVKTRATEYFGLPIEAIDRTKRRMQSRAAIHYLKKLHYPRINFRFDVVEVVGTPDAGEHPIVRHIPNAFQLDPRYRVP